MLQPQADMEIVTAPTTSVLLHQLDAAATTQGREAPDAITGPSASPTTEAPANTCLRVRPSYVYRRRARDAPTGLDVMVPALPQPVMEAEAVSFMDSLLQVQEQPLLQAPRAQRAPKRRGKQQPPPPGAKARASQRYRGPKATHRPKPATSL